MLGANHSLHACTGGTRLYGWLVLSTSKRLYGNARVPAVGCTGSWCRLLTIGCRGKLRFLPSAKQRLPGQLGLLL